MKRNLIFSVVLLSLAMPGCKTGGDVIKVPQKSTEHTQVLGSEIIDLLQVGNNSLYAFRHGDEGNELNVVKLAADGSLQDVFSYNMRLPMHGNNKVVHFPARQQFTLLTGFGYLTLDQQGNMLAQASWRDLLDLSYWHEDISNAAGYLSHSDNSYCIESRPDKLRWGIHCYDTSHYLLWQRIQPAIPDVLQTRFLAAQASDGTLYVLSTENGQRLLQAHSRTGEILWEIDASDLPGTYVKKLQIINGKLVMARFSSADDTEYHFLHFNLDGTLHSSRLQAVMGGDWYLEPHPADGYVMLAKQDGVGIEIARMAMDGQQLWKKSYPGKMLHTAFNLQDRPLRVDAQGNAVMIYQSNVFAVSVLYFPVKVTYQYFVTRFDAQGNVLQDDLLGRWRYRIVSESQPTRNTESGFAPEEFVLTATGYVAAGLNTAYLDESSEQHTYDPPLVVNQYNW